MFVPDDIVPDYLCPHRLNIKSFKGRVLPRLQAFLEGLDSSPQTGLLTHFRFYFFQLVSIEGPSLQDALR